MDQHTVTTVLTGLGVVVAMVTYLHAVAKGLGDRIDRVEAKLDHKIDRVDAKLDSRCADLEGSISALRTELKGDISELRTELKADLADLRTDLARLDGRLTTIEQRTYDLSTRLPPAPAGRAG